MKVRKLIIKGFKGYEKEVKYSFEDYSVIEGGNFLGKTSIGEAIVWSLYGCNLEGICNDNLLLNSNSKSISVVIDFEIEGRLRRIERKKGKTLSLKLDGNKITQLELDMVLPNKDIFLLIFSPLKYMSNKSNTRNMLIELLNINEMTILDKYGYSEDKKSIILKYPNSNIALSTLSKLITESEALLLQKQGEKLSFEKMINDNVPVDDSNLPKANIRIKASKLKRKIAEIENEKPTLKDLNKIELRMISISNDYTIMLEKQDLFVGSNKETIHNLEIEISNLKGKSSIIEEEILKLCNLSGVCECCGQAVSNEYKGQQIINFQKRILGIDQQVTSMEKTIEMLKESDEEEKKLLLSKNKDAVEKLAKANEQIEKEFADAKEHNKKVKEEHQLDKEIRIKELKEELEKCQKEINRLDEYEHEKKLIQNNAFKFNVRLREIEEVSTVLKREILKLKDEREYIKEYNIRYVEYVNEQLAAYLNDIKIELFKINESTGELVEYLNILYEDKLLEVLSVSEQIKTSLYIAKMFNDALSLNIPTFVDNGESILDIPKIGSQMLVTVVNNTGNINIINDTEYLVEEEDDDMMVIPYLKEDDCIDKESGFIQYKF